MTGGSVGYKAAVIALAAVVLGLAVLRAVELVTVGTFDPASTVAFTSCVGALLALLAAAHVGNTQ